MLSLCFYLKCFPYLFLPFLSFNVYLFLVIVLQTTVTTRTLSAFPADRFASVFLVNLSA